LQANQYQLIQQQNQQYQQLQLKEKAKKKEEKKTVAQIFEGQSFPFRLWHLMNNEYFHDVIHWSGDGNSIVIPSESGFVEKVLRRTVHRVFKTESMKSFVRQLNLYGFHKVQLEKDEAFAYLRIKAKQRWPDCVFSQACFKKGRPELLDHVKRRCKVKNGLPNKISNNDFAQQILNPYQMAPAFAFGNRRGSSAIAAQYPQLFPQNAEQLANHFPNVLPQSQRSIYAGGTKRKLHFAEEKSANSKKPIPTPPPSVYFYNQTIGNVPHMIPSNYIGNPIANQSIFAPYPENVNVVPQQTEANEAESIGNSSASESQRSNDESKKDVKNQILSPLSKFCASLFRPGSLNNTPSKSCNVDVGDESCNVDVGDGSDFVA